MLAFQIERDYRGIERLFKNDLKSFSNFNKIFCLLSDNKVSKILNVTRENIRQIISSELLDLRNISKCNLKIVQCLPPPRDRSINIKCLNTGNFNSIFYDFSMVSKTLELGLYNVWAHKVCFSKLPFNIQTFEPF